MDLDDWRVTALEERDVGKTFDASHGARTVMKQLIEAEVDKVNRRGSVFLFREPPRHLVDGLRITRAEAHGFCEQCSIFAGTLGKGAPRVG